MKDGNEPTAGECGQPVKKRKKDGFKMINNMTLYSYNILHMISVSIYLLPRILLKMHLLHSFSP